MSNVSKRAADAQKSDPQEQLKRLRDELRSAESPRPDENDETVVSKKEAAARRFAGAASGAGAAPARTATVGSDRDKRVSSGAARGAVSLKSDAAKLDQRARASGAQRAQQPARVGSGAPAPLGSPVSASASASAAASGPAPVREKSRAFTVKPDARAAAVSGSPSTTARRDAPGNHPGQARQTRDAWPAVESPTDVSQRPVGRDASERKADHRPVDPVVPSIAPESGPRADPVEPDSRHRAARGPDRVSSSAADRPKRAQDARLNQASLRGSNQAAQKGSNKASQEGQNQARQEGPSQVPLKEPAPEGRAVSKPRAAASPERAARPSAPRERRVVEPNPIPPITFPEALPVSGRREEIARAIAANQVVIVCGETGSGKTTQLPKICLDARARSGRGRHRADRPHAAAPDRGIGDGPAHRRGTRHAVRRSGRLQGALYRQSLARRHRSS